MPHSAAGATANAPSKPCTSLLPWVAYNAGRFEALAGNSDSAFEHLHRAKELDGEGESAALFREDSRLDSLRDDPRFQELLA